ncbi:hypothetical protein LCGC14_2246240 [marine sediment metagenome]|uniref:Copper resistance protein D domain-containing protein n=1 Tax=marine sediment metagenome TaxID=412755 RepID=A0A0F9FZ14_9ZZZZ
MISIAIPLHLLAAVIWVGGMFFAYLILRPVVGSSLKPEQSLPLWTAIFERFFKWVWLSLITLLVTGGWMIPALGGMGGINGVGIHVHIMLLLGIFMMLIFMHVFFNPYKKLKNSVLQQDWITAGESLAKIRKLVLLNLIIGIVVIVIASSGRYW